jgi:hypothetical protein
MKSVSLLVVLAFSSCALGQSTDITPSVRITPPPPNRPPQAKNLIPVPSNPPRKEFKPAADPPSEPIVLSSNRQAQQLQLFKQAPPQTPKPVPITDASRQLPSEPQAAVSNASSSESQDSISSQPSTEPQLESTEPQEASSEPQVASSEPQEESSSQPPPEPVNPASSEPQVIESSESPSEPEKAKPAFASSEPKIALQVQSSENLIQNESKETNLKPSTQDTQDILPADTKSDSPTLPNSVEQNAQNSTEKNENQNPQASTTGTIIGVTLSVVGLAVCTIYFGLPKYRKWSSARKSFDNPNLTNPNWEYIKEERKNAELQEYYKSFAQV